MIHVLKKGNSLEDVVVYDDGIKVEATNKENFELIECYNEEDLFLKLLSLFPKEPYWKVSEILKKFNISASRDFLIKSYCSKASRLRYYNGDDLYLVLNYTTKHSLEILVICTYYEYKNYFEKEDCFAVKIKKETLPFYLSLFLNRFTSKDFYFCFKNITGIKNVPVINYRSSEFYLVKNKNKIVSYHTSEDTAIKTLNLINELNYGNNKCFYTEILKVNSYEEFIAAIDNNKIQKESDFDRYMMDFDWYFDYCVSKKHIDVNNLDFERDVFLIRDKTGETIAKENSRDMYFYIKDNKLYSEDIFYLKKSDIDYKDINKFFSLLKKEAINDDILENFLDEAKYLDKVKIINTIADRVSTIKPKENIYYSLTKFKDGYIKLLIFNDKNFFHKHISSLDYNMDNLTYGELNVTLLRKLLEPTSSRNKNNKVFSRADVAFNVSNLFKEKDESIDYLKPLKKMTTIIDVDAYLKDDKSSCGVVIRNQNNDVVAKIAKRLDASTSVEAEIKGAMFALEYLTLVEKDLAKDVCIRYDCFSVADYLISEATSDIGKEYKEFVRTIIKKNPDINIYIKKVRGHSSDFFNDIAHSLAGNFFNM